MTNYKDGPKPKPFVLELDVEDEEDRADEGGATLTSSATTGAPFAALLPDASNGRAPALAFVMLSSTAFN